MEIEDVVVELVLVLDFVLVSEDESVLVPVVVWSLAVLVLEEVSLEVPLEVPLEVSLEV